MPREDALATLADRVAETLPRIRERQEELSAAEDRLRRLRAEHAALSVLRVPDGIAALDADLAASRAEVARLKNAEQEAEHADTAARESLTAAPQRAPLQLARERRSERNRLQDSIPEPGSRGNAARGASQSGLCRRGNRLGGSGGSPCPTRRGGSELPRPRANW